MIGVVLWSDASDRKAVIWCEDQGDLAFLNSEADLFQSDIFFDAGDVVQFDVEIQSSMRTVHNPRLILERAGAGLPEALRQSAAVTHSTVQSAQIIPFEPRKAETQLQMPRVSEA